MEKKNKITEVAGAEISVANAAAEMAAKVFGGEAQPSALAQAARVLKGAPEDAAENRPKSLKAPKRPNLK